MVIDTPQISAEEACEKIDTPMGSLTIRDGEGFIAAYVEIDPCLILELGEKAALWLISEQELSATKRVMQGWFKGFDYDSD